MGFTITELVVATAISFITITVAGQALISHLETTQTAEAVERQRNDWARTSKFIDSEISLSERLITDFDNVSIPEECTLDRSEFRIALDIRRDLPTVIYAVKPSEPDWLMDNSLWRCGPSFNDDGSYNDTIDWSLVVDGLLLSASGGGFSESTNSSKKYTQLTLTIKGKHLSAKSYSMVIGAKARINKLYSRPSENSLCTSNILKVSGSADTHDNLDSSDYGNLTGNLLICGLGCVPVDDGGSLSGCGIGNSQGDTIQGTDARDIIEAGDRGASSLIGAGGHDHLRGSNDHDTISGGDGDDVLVGRAGHDVLEGGSGENLYLPGEGNDSITGGNNLDVIFIEGNIEDFSALHSNGGECTQTSCIVSEIPAGDIKTITGGEVIIFDDARLDLYSE